MGKNKKKNKKKLHTRVKYEKMQCKFIKSNGKRCKKYATGKSTLCAKHGGKTKIEKNLIPTSGIGVTHLKLTKFNPAYHPLEYISLSKKGKSNIEIAALFEIATQTLAKWENAYKEMSIAMEIGKEMQVSWWLTEGKGALKDSRYNTGMFKFLTGNTLGWSDKIEQKNHNMNVHGVLVVPDKLTPEEWQEKAQEDMKKQDAIDAEFFEVE